MTRESVSGLVAVSLLITACGALVPVATNPRFESPSSPEECHAETYDFVGRGSLSSLAILHPDRAEPSQPGDVQGTFWVPHGVTRLYERDDGRSETVRIFCAVLDDGGTMLNMPVAPGWQPPR